MNARIAARITCLLVALWPCAVWPQASKFVRHDRSNSTVIVFVHGVLGDSIATWTNASTKAYWPTLLVNDSTFNSANVYVFQYPSPTVGTAHSVNELAEVMRRRLEVDGVFEHRELIFLSHSMGGLVTRALLLKYRHYASQVRLAYFLSTPTEGSPSAALAALGSRNPQFKNMYPMRADNYLADLQRDWLGARLPIRSFCAYEGRDTFGIRIVDQRSASNLCTEPLDPVLEDHIGIAKPASPDSDAYIAFKNAFRATRQDAVLPVPSGELVSLVSYYEARGTTILAQLDTAITDMATQTPASDTLARSKTLAERKRAAFADVYARHIAALKAGKLTLAAVFENEANEVLLGDRVAYATDPDLVEFRPTVLYERTQTGPHGQLAEYAEIMMDSSLTVGARRSAAVQIIRNCDGSEECVSALAAVLTSPDTQYIHWEAAEERLCLAQGDRTRILPSVAKVLANRHVYADWRLWISALNVAGCIGRSAASLVPLIIDVIERTETQANTYYNTSYIKETAVKSLGAMGGEARGSIPVLQKLVAGEDTILADFASSSLKNIEADTHR